MQGKSKKKIISTKKNTIGKKTGESYREMQNASRNYKKSINSAHKKYKFEEQKKI